MYSHASHPSSARHTSSHMERTGGGHKATVLMGAWATGILIGGESAVFVISHRMRCHVMEKM